MARSCGDCIACCVYLRIDDEKLQKAGMTHCPHLTLPGPIKEDEIYLTGDSCKGNCSVYSDQPKVCDNYKCAWLLGYGNEEDRPDKSLILFDTAHQIENCLEAKPLAPDQEDTEKGRAVINRMSCSFGVPVVVLNFYEKKIKRIVGHGVIPWLL